MATKKTPKADSGKTPEVKPQEENAGLSLKKLDQKMKTMEKKSKKSVKNLQTILTIGGLVLAAIGLYIGVKQVQIGNRKTYEERIAQTLGKINGFFELLDSDDLKKSKIGADGLISYLDTTIYHERIFAELDSRTKNMTRPDVRHWTDDRKAYFQYENELIRPYLLIIEKLPLHRNLRICCSERG